MLLEQLYGTGNIKDRMYQALSYKLYGLCSYISPTILRMSTILIPFYRSRNWCLERSRTSQGNLSGFTLVDWFHNSSIWPLCHNTTQFFHLTDEWCLPTLGQGKHYQNVKIWGEALGIYLKGGQEASTSMLVIIINIRKLNMWIFSLF